MSSYLELTGDPGGVIDTGAQLAGLATEFGASAKEILNEITTIENGKPWGSDEPGKSFEESYNQVPKGGTKPFSEELRGELSDAGQSLGETGNNVVNAVAKYVANDSQGASDISSLSV